jgi:hypothetical protein
VKKDIDLLKRKYRRIADITRPRCLEQCHEPGACCTPRYCELAQTRAREFGVRLPEQGHPTLKYMGTQGCVVPPYLRPLCAVHVCDYHVMRDDAFARAYLELREEVCRAEAEVGPSWPEGMARDFWE